MNPYVAFVIGGVAALAFVKGRQVFTQVKEATKVKTENERLHQENQKLKKQVLQNEADIEDLKKIIPGIESQVITCLELLSSISTVKNQEMLHATYVATLRFRETWGLKDENFDTYISDD